MSDAAAKVGDRVARFAMRYERPFGIAGLAWLAISSASYARFIDLPDIPFITDSMALYSSAAFTAVWWGFARPALDKRKRAISRGSPEA